MIAEETYRRRPRPRSKSDTEMLGECVDFVTTEIQKSHALQDPVVAAKALITARDTFSLLARNGYPSFAPLLFDMQNTADDIARIFRKELVRRLLTQEISDKKAGACLRELSGIIEREWVRWEQTLAEVEAELAAKVPRCA